MIIVDSNIFIFGETESAPERDIAIRKYGEACEKDRIGTNVIILSEVFRFSKKIDGAESAAARVGSILSSPHVDYMEFSPESISRAAKLARDFNLRMNDALVAQQAIDLGASVLTDNVKDFGKIKAVGVIALRPSG